MPICICVGRILSNLHLVTIPMFERHIAENIFNLITRFLDALSGTMTIWHAKLVSVLTNGKSTMTKCHHGVMICFGQVVKFSVLRIWCMPHQIDIVIKNATTLPQNGQWIEVVYKWCVHLHHQEKLIMDRTGEMYPKKTNQWAHLDSMFKFYISCWCQIIKHMDTHAHFKSPSTKWSMITLTIAPMINEINKIVIKL